MDTGEAKLSDDNLIEQLRRTARQINRCALITAIVITLLALAFPVSKL